MRMYVAMLLTLLMFVVVSAAAAQQAPNQQVSNQSPPNKVPNQQLPMTHMSGLLRLVETIPLPIEGWMDHLAVDVKGQRLFICGEDKKSLVTVDLRAGTIIHSTEGLSGNPRKPFYVADTNEIWVDLGDNKVVAISGTTYEQIKVVELPSQGEHKRVPDNAAYDATHHLYYVAVRTDQGNKATIEVVDTRAVKLVGSIPVNGIDPGGLALEPSGKRLYVAMGDVVDGMSNVDVIDIDKQAVVAEWPITGGPAAHVAGLDATHHRLFVGSRVERVPLHEPGKLVVMDTESGKVVQVLDSVGGADEVQYDAPTGRIYFAGTTGAVAVFKEIDPNHYELLGKVPTGAIAKTGLWVPEMKRFYAAVPRAVVMTPPRGSVDKYFVTVDAHLMVFDYLP